MSAAVTAAGYLYASGRLRGRGARENAEPEHEPARVERRPRELKVAVYAPDLPAAKRVSSAATKPAKVPKIQYRTRRWRPA